MGRGPKPAKSKEGKPPVTRKSPKDAGPRGGDLGKRLAEALEQLQTRDRELVEAQEQHAATAEILHVISSSPTEVQPVFDAIVRGASGLLGGLDCIAVRFDGTLMHLLARHNPRAGTRDALMQLYPQPPTRTLSMGRVILDKTIVHIPDVREDAAFDQRYAELIRLRGVLAVPIKRDDSVIGGISVSRSTPGYFSARQIGLLQTFADQAVIAIENVRLFKELEARNRDLTEALDQQTATNDILRVISSSPTDVQPVFDAIVQSATRLCDADFGIAFRFDGQIVTPVALHNMVPDESQIISPAVAEGRGVSATRATVAGRAVLDASVVHIHDLREEPEITMPAYKNVPGYRTVLAVPMLRGGRPIGSINVWRREIRPFSEQHIELLQTFADQAVIAIENVRLFDETKEALEQPTATSEILRVISSSPTDIQPVLDAVAENAAHICAAADAHIRLIEGDTLRAVARFGTAPFRVPDVIPLNRDFPAGRSIIERRTIHIEDVATLGETDFPKIYRETRSLLVTPLVREGVPLGAILVRRVERRAFTERQIELLKTFADQAVIAIENVRLFTELEARNRDLTTALDQQTATSDILKVISSSPTDVQPVFDAIVGAAVRLCHAIQSNVQLFDGQLMHYVAANNIEPAAMEVIQRVYPMPPNRNQMASRAILDKAVAHVPDALEDPEYLRELAVKGGFRSMLSVPMVGKGRPIGAITVGRMEPGLFSDPEVELLKTFADQAVIAIENVRLFNETKEALEQQTATSEILKVISGSPTDLESVLGTVAETAMRVCGARDAMIYRCDGDVLRLACTRGPLPVVPSSLALPLNEKTATGRSVVERRTIHVHDLAAVAASEYP